ncbi:MAG: hypothetical protein FJW24_00300 [Acidimicrobiia bacterium]|nr:hypothetical protein [Acidimicrobiia bacterium]
MIETKATPNKHYTAMPEINSDTNSKRVSRMLGLDLDSWNDVMVASLAIGAAAAVVVLMATFAVIRLQKAESAAAKDEFERYKLAVSVDIAGANERAAEANKIAEGEKLARHKIEEKIRPRVLSVEQEVAMLAILRNAPKGSVFVNPD